MSHLPSRRFEGDRIPRGRVVRALAPSDLFGPAVATLVGSPPKELDGWLAIDADGTVTALTGKCEMGQGLYTAQTQLVAEELGVELDRVKLIQCITGANADQGVTSGRAVASAEFQSREPCAGRRRPRASAAADGVERMAVPPIVQHMLSQARRQEQQPIALIACVVGVGAGQMSRVDSARLAIAKAGERASGAVCASDAFYPFADALEVCAAAGVTAFVQPGGSQRDAEVTAAADAAGAAMLLTGVRHFRH